MGLLINKPFLRCTPTTGTSFLSAFLSFVFASLTTMVVNRKSNFHLRSGLQGDYLKDLDVNGKTIFKLVLKNRI